MLEYKPFKKALTLTKYQAWGAQVAATVSDISDICTQTKKTLNNTKEGNTMPLKNSTTLNLTLLKASTSSLLTFSFPICTKWPWDCSAPAVSQDEEEEAHLKSDEQTITEVVLVPRWIIYVNVTFKYG